MSIIRYQTPSITWNPANRLATLSEQLGRLFDVEPAAGWSPAIDVYEDKENVFVKAELPGVKREDIEIALHDGVLSIAGERKREEEVREEGVYRYERAFGKFERRVAIPAAVSEEKIAAAYKDGVLTVTLPKAEEAKPKKIAIKE